MTSTHGRVHGGLEKGPNMNSNVLPFFSLRKVRKYARLEMKFVISFPEIC